jgi:hypothetical protein
VEQISVSGLCKSLLDAQKNLLQWSLCLDGVGHLERIAAIIPRSSKVFFPGFLRKGNLDGREGDQWRNMVQRRKWQRSLLKRKNPVGGVNTRRAITVQALANSKSSETAVSARSQIMQAGAIVVGLRNHQA